MIKLLERAVFDNLKRSEKKNDLALRTIIAVLVERHVTHIKINMAWQGLHTDKKRTKEFGNVDCGLGFGVLIVKDMCLLETVRTDAAFLPFLLF